ncbi:MAG: branched-chain amino acid ABC transporter permease [Janthinobacterium lividum]
MLAQILIAGLTVGAIYALIGLGFTIVFSTIKIINFAHGEFVMAGGLLSAYLQAAYAVPLIVAVPLAIIACGFIGLLVYQLGVKGIDRDDDPIAQVMITLGIGIVLKGAAQVAIGKDTMFPPPFSTGTLLSIGDISISAQAGWVMASVLVLIALLYWLQRHTWLGMSMRAVSINRYAATLMGVSPQRTATFAFVLAGVIGGAAGALLAPLASTNYENGIALGLKGFAAAMLGGLGSPFGAVLGGVILGISETLAAGYVSSAYKDAVSLILLLAILLLRPQGLLGKPLPEKL